MIPRTKVNYSYREILKALFVSERSRQYRSRLISLLQEYTGEKNILLTPSGRAGLYYILKAIARPRVVIPAYTCNAVVEAAQLAGKEVQRVDIEPGGFNICADDLDKVLDNQTIFVATHQFGFPSDMEAIQSICREKAAFLLEDVAAALGTRVNGPLAGSFGDAAFYSFDSTKLINVPMKGGFLSVKDPVLFESICRIYRKEILRMPFWHKWKLLTQAALLLAIENPAAYRLFHWVIFEMQGKVTAETAEVNRKLTPFYQFDMTDWQSMIAIPQIQKIDWIIKTRQAIYSELCRRLEGCKQFELPPVDQQGKYACIRFPIRTKSDKFEYYRRAFEHGIDCAFSFTYLACPPEFRNAQNLAARVLDLPFYVKLRRHEIERMVHMLRKIETEVDHES